MIFHLLIELSFRVTRWESSGLQVTTDPGDHFSIKMLSYQYRNTHDNNKTIWYYWGVQVLIEETR